MTINCPRCNEEVTQETQHCEKCGYSIKNYIENKRLLIKSEGKENDNSKNVAVCVKEQKTAEDVEDNILKFLSNIKIVKDENYNPEDDELDSGMQAFLVEALNDSYKLKSVKTFIKNPKEYFGEDEENSKDDLEQKHNDDVKDNEQVDIKDNRSKEEVYEEEQKEEVSLMENEKKEDEISNLKLSEPKNDEKLDLLELKIDSIDESKSDTEKKENKVKTNIELNTNELEIIHKRKITLPDEFQIKDGVIIKDITEEKNYDNFYNTIANLRVDKFNLKAIVTVAGVSLVFIVIVALLSGIIMG